LEQNDLALIEKFRKTNYDLDRLYRDHLMLEDKINSLEAASGLGAEEQKKLNSLKKTKLSGRDRMEAILRPLR